MNVVLENNVAALNDELGIAFGKYFGTDQVKLEGCCSVWGYQDS